MDNKFRMQKDFALRSLEEALLCCEVDLEMLPVIDEINRLSDYYTTSSCTGRTNLFFDPGTKPGSGWLGKWHRQVAFKEVKSAMDKLPKKGMVWFMHEPTIMHITCRTVEDASRLVDIARNSGYKKTGILSLKEDRVIVEVSGTERIHAPIAVNGKKLASDPYIKELTAIANKKFVSGMKRLKRLQSAVISLSKP